MPNESAFERVTTAFENHRLAVVHRGVGRASAQAPGHSGADRSISLTASGDQVLMYCHAGEQTEDVLAEVGLTLADLFDNPRGSRYDYPDGRQVYRSPDKKFRQSGNTKGRSLFRTEFDNAERVTVVEGEKDVLALESIGVAATCSAMGAGKASLFDWSPLRGKHIRIVADKDEPGRKHAAQVAELLNGIANSVFVVEAAVGKDAADHIAAGKTLDEFVPIDEALATVGQYPTVADGDEDEKAPRRSVAAQIVDLARAQYRLGIDETDNPFGVTEEHPHIALMLRGGKTGLRAELARHYFAATNAVASQQALADAGMVLEGFAAQQEPQRVHLRVAERDGAVYIDLGDTAGSVIRIASGRWEIVPTAPVLFRRTKLTGELPVPRPGKGGPRLWEFVGIATEDRPILLAVLVAALIQVDVPHVILMLLAEQGSAKSTITRILVSLIDPSPVPLRQPPRDPDGWTTAAAASWVVALDNLSGEIPEWLSNALCRAATGDGNVKRALYTDSDVAVQAFRRCVIVNGIDIVVSNGDLAERGASIGLPRVQHRRPEDELAAEWEQARPEVFAALLDLAAKVHQLLPTVKVEDLPRMADFAKVLAAVDQVMHTDGLARYRRQSRSAAALTLDVPFVAELVAANKGYKDITSADLLAAFTPADKDWRPKKGWPKSARAVTGLLTRHAPAMRAQGWQIDNDEGRNIKNRVRWTITPPSTRKPEKGCNGGSSDSSNSSVQVNGQKRDELEDSAGGQTSFPLTCPSPPNSSKLVNSKALTSENEVTSQTSQESAPSLVACRCGVPLIHTESIARGCCLECAADQQTPERV